MKIELNELPKEKIEQFMPIVKEIYDKYLKGKYTIGESLIIVKLLQNGIELQVV